MGGSGRPEPIELEDGEVRVVDEAIAGEIGGQGGGVGKPGVGEEGEVEEVDGGVVVEIGGAGGCEGGSGEFEAGAFEVEGGAVIGDGGQADVIESEAEVYSAVLEGVDGLDGPADLVGGEFKVCGDVGDGGAALGVEAEAGSGGTDLDLFCVVDEDGAGPSGDIVGAIVELVVEDVGEGDLACGGKGHAG